MKSTWLHLTIFLLFFSVIQANIEDDQYYTENFPNAYEEFIESQNDVNEVTRKPNCKNRKEIENSIEINRQNQPGALMQWIQSILGLRPTTTTEAPPPAQAEDCPECTRCGVAKNGTKIVGGSETGVNQYPWMAMLMYSNRFYCGASLINDRYVVTASHCVHGFNVKRITVRLLEHDRSDAEETMTQTFNVEKIIKHPRYSQTNFDNDIALLKLEKPVKFEGILNPICMPKTGEWYTGYDGVVTGWGTLSEGGDVSQTLQHVEVPIISNTACKKTKYSASRITDNMLCAGYKEGQKDSCQGDSGGPLVVFNKTSSTYELVGVVSWGEGCAKEGYPGVYARTNRYGKWINENTADACKCSPS